MIRPLPSCTRWLAGFALLSLAACSPPAEEEIQTSAAVPVETQPVRRAPIRESLGVTGRVVPAPGALLSVVAPQAGRIAALPFGVGDRVRQGELLVRFDIPALSADLAAREADLVRARARLANAEASVERLSGLLERGIAARKEVEDAERERAEADADVGAARSAGGAARSLSSRAEVRAPFAGVIAARFHNPGDLVDAASGDPVLELADPSRLEVEAEVPAEAAGRIVAGAQARITVAGAAQVWEGTVVAAPVRVDPVTSAAPVRLRLPAGARLALGLPVRVEILGPEHPSALVVPATALVEEGGERFVYTLDGAGRAHRRPVATGIEGSGEIEILRGVAEGERVVVHGQDGLPDGALASDAPREPA